MPNSFIENLALAFVHYKTQGLCNSTRQEQGALDRSAACTSAFASAKPATTHGDADAVDQAGPATPPAKQKLFKKDSLATYLDWVEDYKPNSRLIQPARRPSCAPHCPCPATYHRALQSLPSINDHVLLLRCEHWLEAADEQHRYGSNLRVYFDYWVRQVSSSDDGPELGQDAQCWDQLLNDGRGPTRLQAGAGDGAAGNGDAGAALMQHPVVPGGQRDHGDKTGQGNGDPGQPKDGACAVDKTKEIAGGWQKVLEAVAASTMLQRRSRPEHSGGSVTCARKGRKSGKLRGGLLSRALSDVQRTASAPETPLKGTSSRDASPRSPRGGKAKAKAVHAAHLHHNSASDSVTAEQTRHSTPGMPTSPRACVDGGSPMLPMLLAASPLALSTGAQWITDDPAVAASAVLGEAVCGSRLGQAAVGAAAAATVASDAVLPQPFSAASAAAVANCNAAVAACTAGEARGTAVPCAKGPSSTAAGKRGTLLDKPRVSFEQNQEGQQQQLLQAQHPQHPHHLQQHRSAQQQRLPEVPELHPGAEQVLLPPLPPMPLRHPDEALDTDTRPPSMLQHGQQKWRLQSNSLRRVPDGDARLDCLTGDSEDDDSTLEASAAFLGSVDGTDEGLFDLHEDTDRNNFFLWLDHGEGKNLDLADQGVPREKLEREKVLYLSPDELAGYEVVVDKATGLLKYKKSGAILHTYGSDVLTGEGKRGKEGKEGKNAEEGKDGKEGKEAREGKEGKARREGKEGRVAEEAGGIGREQQGEVGPKPTANGGQLQAQTTDSGKTAADLTAVGPAAGESAAAGACAEPPGPAAEPEAEAVPTLPGLGPLTDQQGAARKWIWVVSPDGKLYVGPKIKGQFHHSSFLRGALVMAAGNMAVCQGQLIKLTADSGHYWPQPDHFKWFFEHLSAQGADLTALEGLEFRTKH